MALSNACPKIPIGKKTREEEKADRVRDEEKHRKEIKALVWKRDGAMCRVCGKPADEMHELHFRSLGGDRSTKNSIAVCTWRRNNCHRHLQKHAIEVEGTNADKRLVFRWNLAVVSKPLYRLLSKRRSQNREAAA